MRRLLLPLLALMLCQPAAAATTRLDRHGTVVLDGRKVFPIALAKGPPADGLAEVAAAGRERAQGRACRGLDGGRSRAHDRREPRGGVKRALDLGEPERVRPAAAGRLARVAAPPCRRNAGGRSVRERDRALEGRATSPGASGCVRRRFVSRTAWRPGSDRSWCAGRAPVDTGRLLVTVQAPRAGVWSLAPYSEVTDVHGVNSYPIAIGDPDPDLGEPGSWTNILGLATPRRCGVDDARDLLDVELRRGRQRPAADAGAAALHGLRRDPRTAPGRLAFYGGQNPKCWGSSTRQAAGTGRTGSACSSRSCARSRRRAPLAPALRNPGTTRELPTLGPLGAGDLAPRPQRRALGDRGAGRR